MEAPNRVIASMVGLAGLWVLVYWLWPAEPAVKFAVAADGSRTPVPASVSDTSEDEASPSPTAGDSGTTSQSNTSQPNTNKLSPTGPKTSEAQASANQPQGPAVRIAPPQFREYRVLAGDTLAAISNREFGTAKHADAIAQANQLMSPAHLKAGRIIRIPVDPTNIQGVAVVLDEQGTPQRVPTTTPSLPVAEYVVRKGDSLASIARRVYGSEAHVQKLIDANKQTLQDPANIRPGQTILVPQAAPATIETPQLGKKQP